MTTPRTAPAWYNEIDRDEVPWLAELSRRGLIAPGIVESRSIRDLSPEDIGHGQAHFFAGVGVWSHALRLAGIPDELPVWTGSCPCQPFSSAGKRRGVEDERHLWPEWFRLIRERRPLLLFGEQVGGKAGRAWFDAVQADLEGVGYTVGATELPAASVGAPHRRQRLFFGAHSDEAGPGILRGLVSSNGNAQPGRDADGCGEAVHGADADHGRRRAGHGEAGREGREVGLRTGAHSGDGGEAVHGADAELSDGAWPAIGPRGCDASPGAGAHAEPRRCGRPLHRLESIREGLEGFSGHVREWRGPGWVAPEQARSASEAGATRGFWGGCDWWLGRDGKARPAGPGVFPLVDGAPARMVRLRAYGNAIVPQVAAEFVSAFMDAANL